MKKKSEYGKLNFYDVNKSIILLIGTSIMGSLIPIISTGKLPGKQEFLIILGTAIGAGLTYLVKQLRTDSNGDLK